MARERKNRSTAVQDCRSGELECEINVMYYRGRAQCGSSYFNLGNKSKLSCKPYPKPVPVTLFDLAKPSLERVSPRDLPACAASRRAEGLNPVPHHRAVERRASISFATTEMRKKQNQEDEQEQQPLGSLPEGPLVEILSRVPYRSLCRFKCVSKPWLALCSAPDIRKRSPQTLSGFFYKFMARFCNLSGRGQPMVDPILPFLDKSYELVIPQHCCSGLVLCRCWKSLILEQDEYNLVVCNPATGKWTELPPCPIGLPSAAKQYLGFDPATPSRFVVFAHLWKLYEVAIYSSDTGRWTTVQTGWTNQHFPTGPSECAFMNGTLHLMTDEGSIVTVDTQGRVWKEIDIPGNMAWSYVDPSIGQSQGRLYAW